MPEHYSIGEAAAAASISTETLRIWERRYGRPSPERRASGHRRYTQGQVDWLKRVSKVVSKGMRPSRVMKLSDAELQELSDERPPAPSVAPEVEQLMAATRDLDGQTFIVALDRAFTRRDATRFAMDIVKPLSEELFRAVESGALDVRHENYANGILEDYLHARCAQHVIETGAPSVVIATLEGDRCRARMQMAALVAATRGVGHRVLAGDPEPAVIGAAVRHARADTLVVCVPSGAAGASKRIINAIRAALPQDVAVLVAGPGVDEVAGGLDGIGGIASFEHLSEWLHHRHLTHQLAAVAG